MFTAKKVLCICEIIIIYLTQYCSRRQVYVLAGIRTGGDSLVVDNVYLLFICRLSRTQMTIMSSTCCQRLGIAITLRVVLHTGDLVVIDAVTYFYWFSGLGLSFVCSVRLVDELSIFNIVQFHTYSSVFAKQKEFYKLKGTMMEKSHRLRH